MKILLVSLYYGPQHQALVAMAKAKIINPPLGILQLATVVRARGHDVSIIDEQGVEGMTPERYVDLIRTGGYEVVGFGVNTLNFNYFVRLSRHIKEMTGVTVIAGGVHITALGERALHPHVDYLFLGEADDNLPDFLDARAVGDMDRIRKLPGILFDDGGTIVNNRLALAYDLDRLPFADRGLMNVGAYRTTLPDGSKVPSTGISMSRGCPYKCVFCSEQILTGNRYRCHSPEYVFEEMKYVQDQFGISHINFYDSTFNIRRKTVMRLCELIIESGRKFTFSVGARAGLLDPEMVAAMKQAGLVRIAIAIESGNEEILKLIKKNQTKAELVAAFKMCASQGLATEGMAIIGNPGDTLRTMFQTAEFIRSLDTIGISSLGIAIPYPGTELYDMAKANHHGLKLISENWDHYHVYGPGVMTVGRFSPAQMVLLQKFLMVWSYMRANRIASVIRTHGLLNMIKSFLVFVFRPRGSVET